MVYFDDFLSRVPAGVDSDEALDTLVTYISEPNLRNSIDQMRREVRTVPLAGKDGLRLFLNDAADRYTRGHNDEDGNRGEALRKVRQKGKEGNLDYFNRWCKVWVRVLAHPEERILYGRNSKACRQFLQQ